MSFRERSLISALFSIISAKLAILIISILFTPILVRLLGAGKYGDYAFVISVMGVLMIFANAGVGEGLRKHLPEEQRPESWKSDVFGFYTRFSLILSVLVAGPLLLLTLVDFFGVLGFVDGAFIRYFQLLAAIIVLKQLYRVLNSTLMGLGYERYSEPLKILREGSFAVFALALVYFGLGVSGVLIAYIISLVFVIFVSVAVVIKIVDFGSVVRNQSHLPRRELMSFNFMSIVLTFLGVSLYQLDILLLRPLTGDEATGYYKAALVVAQLIWMVPNALQALLLHSSSKYWSEDELSSLNNIASLSTRFTLVTIALMAGGLAVLAGEFIPLYFGPEFIAAVTPMLLLLPGVIGFGIARPMFAIGQGSGNLRPLVYATGGAAVINAVLNILLIPQYGMVGAAIGTSIGYGSMALFYSLASRSIGFNPTSDLRLLEIGFSLVISIIVMHVVSTVIINSYLTLIVVPVIGTIVYVFLSIRTGAVSSWEIKLVTDKLPNPFSARIDSVLTAVAPETEQGPPSGKL